MGKEKIPENKEQMKEAVKKANAIGWKPYRKTHKCQLCGIKYEAKKATSKYCCESHRARAWQIREGWAAPKTFPGCEGSTKENRIPHVFEDLGGKFRCVACGLRRRWAGTDIVT